MPDLQPDPAALKAVIEAREALAKLVADYKYENRTEGKHVARQVEYLNLYPWHHSRWNEDKSECSDLVRRAEFEMWNWLKYAEERTIARYLEASGAAYQAHLLVAAGHPEDALAEAKRAERVLTGQSVAEQATGRGG